MINYSIFLLKSNLKVDTDALFNEGLGISLTSDYVATVLTNYILNNANNPTS